MSDRPRGPRRFQYVRIAVPDLSASIDFYENFVGLEMSSTRDGGAQLRAGLPHHAIDLTEDRALTEARTLSFGYSMKRQEDLDALHKRVADAGLAIDDLPESSAGSCMDGFAVTDPGGFTWEFVSGFFEYAEEPRLVLTPRRLMHPFLITPQYAELLPLYVDVFGFMVSDYIENYTAFLRGENRYHHSLAVLQMDQAQVNHINFVMKSLDDVMRGRSRAIHAEIPISCDLVLHSASGTIACYMHDKRHGPQIELSYGHRRFSKREHESHMPRRMARGARTEIDLWRVDDDDWRGE